MDNKIEALLHTIEKPARYLGNEWNAIKKPHAGLTTVALAFPDVYEVAMSHLGLQILYQVVNDRQDAVAERVFAPWVDMEAAMRGSGVPLFSLESWTPVRCFDFLGFTLQYEMSYSNIVNMLDLAGVPLLASERGEDDPFIIAGGPCAYNPEPIAALLDIVVLGEAEEVLDEILEVYHNLKQAGLARTERLKKLAHIKGVYVPAFYDVSYQGDGTIAAVTPQSGLPAVVEKRVLSHLGSESFPRKPIVPYLKTVHDRLVLEIFRGCTRGCRFCQAGMIYRPVRERNPADVLAGAVEALKRTGYEEVSLMSLSTMDYTQLDSLVEQLLAKMDCEGISLSLPSLRADSFSIELAKRVQQNKRSGLTLAPEAGSQRLRDVINKQVTEDDLLTAVAGAQEAGWTSVKLYFMIGLPTETEEDLAALAELARRTVWVHKEKGQKGKPMKVTVSTSSFVPKPWTPFQWEPQDSMYSLEQKQRLIKDLIKRERNITYKYHEADLSFLEAIFARGDRKLSRVLLRAHELGCRFDGWSEHFVYEKWMQAFADCDIDPTFYANRQRDRQEVLPWDHLSPGVDKEYLWDERERAWQAALTVDCRDTCPACGVCSRLPAKTFLAKEQ